MATIQVYLTVSFGVLIAIVYPGLYRYVRKEFPPEAGVGVPQWLQALLKKYLALLALCLLSALIVMAIYKNQKPDVQISFWAALALGFAWESCVEKVIFPKSATK